MLYRAATFELYGALFKEAHTTLTKEGQGLFQRAGNWMRRLVAKPGALGRAETRATRAEEGLHRAQQSIDDAAHRMSLQDADLGIARSAAEKAQRESAKHVKELEAFGADPGALTRARRVAIGAGALGGLGLAAAPVAYSAARSKGEQERKRTRNLAFGAGAATGLAAPKLIRGLGQAARGVGQTGLFPEMQGYPGMGGGYPGVG
jgi:hypothetical protein